MKPDLWLLYPEWQSSGGHPELGASAIALAREAFPEAPFVRVDCPATEALEIVSGIVGLEGIARRFKSTLRELRRREPVSLAVIGGSCGVDAAPIAYLAERYGEELCVLWFDAHPDLNTPASSPSGHFHGMVLRTLLGDGPSEFVDMLPRKLLPSQVVLAGTRAVDVPEADYISERDIDVVPVPELSSVLASVRRGAFRYAHLHIDLDVLDSEEFPDALIAVPGGVDVATLSSVLAALSVEIEVVGVSIVEFCRRSETSIETVRRIAAAAGLPT